MASGTSLPPRQREREPRDDNGNGRFLPGLTPVSLFLVLVLFWVTIQMGSLLVTALMAVLLGTILEGPVSRIQKRNVPRAAAIAMVYVGVIGVIAALIVLIIPVVQDQVTEFRDELPVMLDELHEDWSDSSNPLLSGPGASIIQSGQEFIERPAESVNVSGQTAEAAIPIVTSVGAGLVSVVTSLVVTFYYLLEKKLIRRVVIDQLSPKYQPRVDHLWTEVEQKVGGWLRGQLQLCLIIGVTATIAYGILGLPFWPLLGLWAGITEIIPIVGPWLGGIPAVIVALTVGPETALIVALIIVGMQTLENWVLVPRVMRGAVGLTPMTVFVAILAGTELMGIVGAVLAIPIAATIQVILTNYLNERRSRLSSEQTQVSGWRWMLNRGMGRDSAILDEDPTDDDDHAGESQVVSERDYPGTEDAISLAGPGDEPVVDAGDTPETNAEPEPSREEATWPGNPWRQRSDSARATRAWKGMSRPRQHPGIATSDEDPASTPDNESGSKDT